MATCLYAGVLTDTGSFCYEGTDAHAFELARELVGRGADPAGIAREVYFSNPLSKMLLLGAALYESAARRQACLALGDPRRHDRAPEPPRKIAKAS